MLAKIPLLKVLVSLMAVLGLAACGNTKGFSLKTLAGQKSNDEKPSDNSNSSGEKKEPAKSADGKPPEASQPEKKGGNQIFDESQKADTGSSGDQNTPSEDGTTLNGQQGEYTDHTSGKKDEGTKPVDSEDVEKLDPQNLKTKGIFKGKVKTMFAGKQKLADDCEVRIWSLTKEGTRIGVKITSGEFIKDIMIGRAFYDMLMFAEKPSVAQKGYTFQTPFEEIYVLAELKMQAEMYKDNYYQLNMELNRQTIKEKDRSEIKSPMQRMSFLQKRLPELTSDPNQTEFNWYKEDYQMKFRERFLRSVVVANLSMVPGSGKVSQDGERAESAGPVAKNQLGVEFKMQDQFECRDLKYVGEVQ